MREQGKGALKEVIHVKNRNVGIAFYKTNNIDLLANNESVAGLKTALETLEATNLDWYNLN